MNCSEGCRGWSLQRRYCLRAANLTSGGKSAYARQNLGVVNDPNLRNKLRSFLENAAKSKTNVTKETDKKITQVEFEGDAVAHLINLEHR